jgi:Tol biopolymer transport system component/DNA-binding winged helix-turn-helix (wHTH) protein
MAEAVASPRLVQFGIFELDLQTGELRKAGQKLKFSGQPFQVLAILLERPGEVVTREELQKRLWPDTFVDVDHNLNTAINKIREVLADATENPRFVETLPRRGYRFIAPVDGAGKGAKPATITSAETAAPRRWRVPGGSLLFGALLLLAGVGFLIYRGRHVPASPKQRTLTRITFDDGLQIGATWSPDGHFIAYSSDRGGKFDIWVQQFSGGDPVQITKGPGHHWQPDWSPDGKYIAYRSEEGEGGLYIVPALGGAGLERKISSFGYFPRWSPDSSQILFQTHFAPIEDVNKFYVAHLDGGPPRGVLAEFLAQHKLWPAAAVWHPDGKRVSIWVSSLARGQTLSSDAAPSPSIWTVPISGGEAIKMEIAPAIKNELAEVANGNVGGEHLGELSFSWSPSGKTLYFECGYRGAINIWKMTIEPETLRATAVERLTTGPGPDGSLAVSSDGRRLAFTAKSQQIRNWLFPFDANKGRITDKGQPITAAGRNAFLPNLSRDGKHVAFCVRRGGIYELWEKSLLDGREAPIIADEHSRVGAQLWSPDGMQLVYSRQKSSEATPHQLMIWSSQSHSEEPLTTLSDTTQRYVYDWSSDGAWLLVSQNTPDSKEEVWLLPVAAAPHAETAARKIISDPKYDLYQPHFSPNGRWIVFEATGNSPTIAESALYVVPAAGGAWTRITDGKHWDDKPRWSPDGKTIYFVSGRVGVFNVWGIHFDPAQGKPVGEPFRVSAFEGHGPMIPLWIPLVELSLSENKLVLNMAEVSGGIWVLDNVDR